MNKYDVQQISTTCAIFNGFSGFLLCLYHCEKSEGFLEDLGRSRATLLSEVQTLGQGHRLDLGQWKARLLLNGSHDIVILNGL